MMFILYIFVISDPNKLRNISNLQLGLFLLGEE